MIKNIKIKNFQSHKNTEINFHKNINSIVGSTDSGKTSILRAINWVINNRPRNTAYITHECDFSFVSIEIDNNIITRYRSNKENKYILNDKEFHAVSGNVPKEISEILKFSSINIHKQLDTPFLLTESSGGIAKFLNKIIGIDEIDIILSEVEKSRRSEKSKIKQYESESENLSKEINKLQNINKAENLYRKYEILYNNVKNKLEKKEELNNIIIKIKKYKEKIVKYPDFEKAKKILNKIEYSVKNKCIIQDKCNYVNEILNELNESKNKILILNKNIKENKEKMPETCPICNNPIKP